MLKVEMTIVQVLARGCVLHHAKALVKGVVRAIVLAHVLMVARPRVLVVVVVIAPAVVLRSVAVDVAKCVALIAEVRVIVVALLVVNKNVLPLAEGHVLLLVVDNARPAALEIAKEIAWVPVAVVVMVHVKADVA